MLDRIMKDASRKGKTKTQNTQQQEARQSEIPKHKNEKGMEKRRPRDRAK